MTLGVFCPAGLPSHPQHLLAKELLTKGYCGVFSFYVNGSAQQTKDFMKNLKVTRALDSGPSSKPSYPISSISS